MKEVQADVIEKMPFCSKRKRFWTPEGFWVTERVAKDNFAEIPASPSLPADCKGLFLFRLDADLYLEEGQQMVLEMAKQYGIKTTWFINIEAYEKFIHAFDSLCADPLVEIQSHAYRHEVFKTKLENRQNLEKAEDFLSGVKKRAVKGVVAPYGHWNLAYQEAMEELAYAYSSEFSLGYDRLPFYPQMKGRQSSVLQLPIHPVCTGSFLHAKLPLESAQAYFENIIKAKYSQKLPILLYGHPNDPNIGYNQKVLEHIFKCATALDGIRFMNFSEYYQWFCANNKGKEQNLQKGKASFCVNYSGVVFRYSFWQLLQYKLNCLRSEIIHYLLDDILSKKGKEIILQIWKKIK